MMRKGVSYPLYAFLRVNSMLRNNFFDKKGRKSVFFTEFF